MRVFAPDPAHERLIVRSSSDAKENAFDNAAYNEMLEKAFQEIIDTHASSQANLKSTTLILPHTQAKLLRTAYSDSE